MAILQQSTAYSRKFLMVLSSDHITGATGLAGTIVVKLSKGPGAAGTTAAGAVTELDATHNPGVYQVALTVADTGVAGDLWYTCSVATCDNTDFVDQVQPQVFTQLQLDANGFVKVSSNVKQNTALAGFTFVMTNAVTGLPMTGLTVTAQRSLGGAGFAPCVNAVTELSNGIYVINLAAGDLNAPVVMLRFTATGANDLDLQVITQP